jgi:hypothetical protein
LRIFVKYSNAITVRFLIILFCVNLFSGGILFNEMAKVPALAKHFQVHRQETPDLNFLQFVWLHYGDSAHQNDPAHNHHSLPFHLHCGMNGLQMAHSLPAPSPVLLPEPGAHTPALSAANFYYQHYLPSGFQQPMFQPPRA